MILCLVMQCCGRHCPKPLLCKQTPLSCSGSPFKGSPPSPNLPSRHTVHACIARWMMSPNHRQYTCLTPAVRQPPYSRSAQRACICCTSLNCAAGSGALFMQGRDYRHASLLPNRTQPTPTADTCIAAAGHQSAAGCKVRRLLQGWLPYCSSFCACSSSGCTTGCIASCACCTRPSTS